MAQRLLSWGRTPFRGLCPAARTQLTPTGKARQAGGRARFIFLFPHQQNQHFPSLIFSPKSKNTDTQLPTKINAVSQHFADAVLGQGMTAGVAWTPYTLTPTMSVVLRRSKNYRGFSPRSARKRTAEGMLQKAASSKRFAQRSLQEVDSAREQLVTP